MIQLTKVPIQTLDPKTGVLTGALPKAKPADIGMPIEEFQKQVMDLANKKVPLAKALSAIDKHDQITDKPRAKLIAQAIYAIVGANKASGSSSSKTSSQS